MRTRNANWSCKRITERIFYKKRCAFSFKLALYQLNAQVRRQDDTLVPRIDLVPGMEFNVYDNLIVSLDTNLKTAQAYGPLMFYFYYKKFPELAKLAKKNSV